MIKWDMYLILWLPNFILSTLTFILIHHHLKLHTSTFLPIHHNRQPVQAGVMFSGRHVLKRLPAADAVHFAGVVLVFRNFEHFAIVFPIRFQVINGVFKAQVAGVVAVVCQLEHKLSVRADGEDGAFKRQIFDLNRRRFGPAE